jgi:hypothetical protein
MLEGTMNARHVLLSYLILSLLIVPVLADPPVSAPIGNSLIWNVPGDIPEMMAACKDIPALYNFARSPANFECGYQAILFGDKVPIAPAPHINWARPYARGKLKILAISSFGGSGGDTAQLAQLARELDCDLRFVLVAHEPIAFDYRKDEAYRLGYLAPQARAALQEDYDVILLAYNSYSPGHGSALAGPIFPDDVYRKILEKVKAGTGLVFVGSNMGGWWIDKTPLLEASPAEMVGDGRLANVPEVEAGPDLSFLDGVPLDDLPHTKPGSSQGAWACYDWKPRPGAKIAATESGKPLVICGQYGQGRTVLLGWDSRTIAPVESRFPRLQYEHGLATTLRAITYAAGKEPPVSVVPQAAQFPAGAPGTVTVTTSGPATLEWTVRNADLETLAEGKEPAIAGDKRLTLPALPAGSFWLDLIARDAKGASLGWGSAPLTVTCDTQLLLATDKQVYRVGETVHLVGSLTNAPANAAVQVEIRDAAGRVLASGPARDQGQGKLTYDYHIADARVAPHYAIVAVSAPPSAARGGRQGGEAPLLRERVEFFVPNSAWTDYENILWPEYTQVGALNANARDVAGLTAVMDQWGGDYFGKAGAPYGLRPAQMSAGVIDPARLQVDPAAADQDVALDQAIPAAQKYGTVCWCFQDERNSMSDTGVPNAESLRRYRAYLQAQYKTLAALNASWGTHYTDWDAIPATLDRDLTAQTTNLAPWVDFRLFIADEEYQADKRHAERVREAMGGQAYIGLDAFTTTGQVIPYGGVDFGRLLGTGVFNFYCPYDDHLMIASMARGPVVEYIGWGMGKPTYFGYPWRDAFRGAWGSFRYIADTFFSQFGWIQPAGGWIGAGTEQLRQGVGKVLMGAQRELSPIAILYSYPSMITSAAAGRWVEGEPSNTHLMWRPEDWSRQAFERELTQCGVSFGYLTDQQVEQGALAGKKLLIIPEFMGMSLSDATCAAIRQFVENGGLVVADLCPAVCDEHGKLREVAGHLRGGLDDLFGVTHDRFAFVQRAQDYLVGITKNDPLVDNNGWWIGEWFEKTLKVTDGTALGKHWFLDIPAFVVKQTGKGQTLLMNFLQSATVKRNGQPEEDDLKMVQLFLRAAGITPPVDLVDNAGVSLLKDYEVNVLRDGPIEYTGVYCVTSPDNPEDVSVVFADARDTYDVRAGKYLGRVKQAAIPIKAYGAALFARLDYQVAGLTVTAGEAARGSAVPVAVKLTFRGTDHPGRHVVRLEVIAPDGQSDFFYTRNVNVENRAWRSEIHTAFNDQPGEWTIKAREVLSGATATAQFQLK